jgi:hypothetical protein
MGLAVERRINSAAHEGGAGQARENRADEPAHRYPAPVDHGRTASVGKQRRLVAEIDGVDLDSRPMPAPRFAVVQDRRPPRVRQRENCHTTSNRRRSIVPIEAPASRRGEVALAAPVRQRQNSGSVHRLPGSFEQAWPPRGEHAGGMWPECGVTPFGARPSGVLRGDCQVALRQGDGSQRRPPAGGIFGRRPLVSPRLISQITGVIGCGRRTPVASAGAANFQPPRC